MRTIYRLLAILNWGNAIRRGPLAVLRRAVRVKVFKGLLRWMR